MRASVLSLIGATVFLACLDAYLAARLILDRNQAQDAVQERAGLERRVTDLQQAVDTAAEAAAKATHDNPAAASQGQVETSDAARAQDKAVALRRAWLRSELKKLTDPELREAQLNEQKSELRRYCIGLPRELRLSHEEAAALFDALADQELRYEARSLRKLLAGRDGWLDRSVLDEQAREQLVMLLGSSRFDELLEYFDRLPERRRLWGLRSRLGAADALKTDQAAQLSEVMRDERDRLSATMASLGGGVRFQTGYPEDGRLRGSDRTSQLKFDEEQIERVTEHYVRIRERASMFMTPRQVQRLKEQQQSKLVSMQRLLMQRRRVDLEVAAMRRTSAKQ